MSSLGVLDSLELVNALVQLLGFLHEVVHDLLDLRLDHGHVLEVVQVELKLRLQQGCLLDVLVELLTFHLLEKVDQRHGLYLCLLGTFCHLCALFARGLRLLGLDEPFTLTLFVRIAVHLIVVVLAGAVGLCVWSLLLLHVSPAVSSLGLLWRFVLLGDFLLFLDDGWSELRWLLGNGLVHSLYIIVELRLPKGELIQDSIRWCLQCLQDLFFLVLVVPLVAQLGLLGIDALVRGALLLLEHHWVVQNFEQVVRVLTFVALPAVDGAVLGVQGVTQAGVVIVRLGRSSKVLLFVGVVAGRPVVACVQTRTNLGFVPKHKEFQGT